MLETGDFVFPRLSYVPYFEKPALAWTIPWDADWVTAVTFLGDTPRLAAANKLGQILIFDPLPKAEGDYSRPFPPVLPAKSQAVNPALA